MSNPFSALGLSPEATVDEIKEAWRGLASIHHPDRGGDAAEFHRLRQAYQQALAEAEAPKSCPTCHGRKYNLIQQGWSSVKLICGTCQGSGEVA